MCLVLHCLERLATVDILTPTQRSRNMARIRGAHTVPERILRSALHRMGLRFRLHQPDLPGRPDIVLRRFRAAIFVHGCFWHRHRGCSYAATPKTRAKFWEKKLNGNRGRDSRQIRSLVETGWRVLVVWECALRAKGGQAVATSVTEWIRGQSPFSEIPGATTRDQTEGRRRRVKLPQQSPERESSEHILSAAAQPVRPGSVLQRRTSGRGA